MQNAMMQLWKRFAGFRHISRCTRGGGSILKIPGTLSRRHLSNFPNGPPKKRRREGDRSGRISVDERLNREIISMEQIGRPVQRLACSKLHLFFSYSMESSTLHNNFTNNN